ncbi:MAG: 3-phenylpropionate MFS transporter [Planctomycetes bacterium]|nr:3-phenylpropionate MFS transporter [Planctomycetota bacterium]
MFAVLGAWLPYWPKWLEARGCDDRQIGWLLAVAICVRTVATPWIAARADRSGRRRRALALLSALAAASFLPFGAMHGFAALLVPSFLFGLFYPTLIPLCDNLTVLAAREHGLRYGRMRLWGSLAFLVAVVAVGRLVDVRGPEIVYGVVLGALCFAALAAPLVPECGGRGHVPAPGERPIRTLLRDPALLRVLAVAGVVQASHGAYYSFSTLHWTAHGISETTVGWLWAEGVVAEIVLFAVGAGWADRMGARRLFLLGAGAAVLRWVVLASSVDQGVLAATNWLHALSFGATHLAAIGHLQRHVPPAFSATAQSLLSALSTGVAMALSTALSGVLFARFGGGVFWAMAAIASCGAVIALRTVPPRQRPTPA